MKFDKKEIVPFCMCLLTLVVCLLMAFCGILSRKYVKLEEEVKKLNLSQYSVIEQNKRLVSEISTLTSSERIEDIAVNELGMRKAESEEIMRVEVKGK